MFFLVHLPIRKLKERFFNPVYQSNRMFISMYVTYILINGRTTTFRKPCIGPVYVLGFLAKEWGNRKDINEKKILKDVDLNDTIGFKIFFYSPYLFDLYLSNIALKSVWITLFMKFQQYFKNTPQNSFDTVLIQIFKYFHSKVLFKILYHCIFVISKIEAFL